MKRIAIIGYGASSIITIYNLLKQAKNSEFCIDVFAKDDSCGVAYETNNDNHLLNVRAINISGVLDDNYDFVNYLINHGYKYNEHDFVPRKIYKEYLKNLRSRSFDFASNKNISLSLFYNNIEEISCQDSKFFIGDIKRGYDFVFLCISAKFIDNNFFNIDISKYIQKSEIHIKGAGLTAFDAIISLQDLNYMGTIFLHSRSKRIPQPHNQKINNFLNPIIDISDAQIPLSILFKKFVSRCRNSDNWQEKFDSIRPITNDIWNQFTLEKKKRFMRHLFRLYNIHRHRSPISIYNKIAHLLMYQKVVLTNEALKNLDFIDCTGFNFNYRDQLIESLIANNIVRKNELEMGIDSSKKNFFIIGALNSGSLLETTAINEIKCQVSYFLKNFFSKI